MREIKANFISADELAFQAAVDLAEKIRSLMLSQKTVHIVLTGGTVGIKTLAALAPHLEGMELENLELWFGDERFVDAKSPERNYSQAFDALISKIFIPANNVHQMPSSGSTNLHEAAEIYAKKFENANPKLDVVLLGVGPDAHVASLFPNGNPTSHGEFVVSESNSPKPPLERISLSYKALCGATEVWFLVAGAEKAPAVEKIFNGDDLPATKVTGTKATIWYLDKAAAKLISA